MCCIFKGFSTFLLLRSSKKLYLSRKRNVGKSFSVKSMIYLKITSHFLFLLKNFQQLFNERKGISPRICSSVWPPYGK